MEAGHPQVLKAAMLLSIKNKLVWSEWLENLFLLF